MRSPLICINELKKLKNDNSSFIGLVILIVIAALGLLKFSAPFTNIINFTVPDDAFYYFQTARNFANTGFSSFDGMHFTNGYQPLWFMVCAVVFVFFPNGGETPVYLLLFIQWGSYAFASILLFKSFQRMFFTIPAAIAAILWVSCSFTTSTNGLETGVLALVYILIFEFYGRNFVAEGTDPGVREHLILGAMAGFLFLARTDMNFVIMALGVALMLRARWSRAHLTKFFAFLLPLCFLAGGYLLSNYIATGHLMPVSGAAKIYHSNVTRNAAIAAGAAKWRVYVDNIIWVVRDKNFHYVLLGLVGPWCLLLLSLCFPNNLSLRQMRGFWPFYVGAAASFGFYCFFFYAGFTKTLWYYLPHTLLGALVSAAFSSLIPKAREFPGVTGLLSFIPLSFVIHWGGRPWLSLASGLLLLAAAVMLIWISKTSLRLVFIFILVVVAQYTLAPQYLPIASKCYLICAFLFVMGNLIPRHFHSIMFEFVIIPVVFILAIYSTTYIYVRNIAQSEPRHWNMNLYLGAMWARDHLPSDATIWSGSTGILGYFSERRCVNTDGLINDYNFLENYLKAGKNYDYVRMWDYSIDAHPDERMKDIFMGGHFIELPPEFQRFPFKDGNHTRVLRVYKMPTPLNKRV